MRISIPTSACNSVGGTYFLLFCFETELAALPRDTPITQTKDIRLWQILRPSKDLKIPAYNIRVVFPEIMLSSRDSSYRGRFLHNGHCDLPLPVRNEIRPQNPKWEDRDRFILSKGHCAGAVYMAQAYKGYFDKQELLDTYLRLDSRFGMHPCADMLNSFEISTGSLGHGLSIAIGMALAAKMDRKTHRIFVIVGDGKSQEGSVWEGLMAGPQFKLGNLVVIVDRNGLSMDGPQKSI